MKKLFALLLALALTLGACTVAVAEEPVTITFWHTYGDAETPVINDVIIPMFEAANPGIKVAGVLICQWHNSEVVRQGEALLRGLSLPVFTTVIRRTEKVPESTFQRRPVMDYSPRSAASLDYRAWVWEYLREGGVNDGEEV